MWVATGAASGAAATRGDAEGAVNSPGLGTRIHVSSGRKSIAAQSMATVSHTFFGD